MLSLVSALPRCAFAHHNQGIALSAAGHLEKAETALATERDLNGALQHYRRAIALQPDSAIVHFNLGTFFESQQRLSEAVVVYRSALRLNPRAVDVWNNLRVVFAKQNQMNDAAQAFRRAIELVPDNAAAKLNLDRAELMLQRPAP